MKLRRIMAVLVTLGLLSHALALVMHNAMALEAALNGISLSDVICQNSGQSEVAQAETEKILADLVAISKTGKADKTGKDCPVCLGLASAHSVIALEQFVLPAPVFVGSVEAVVSEPAFRSFRLGWPPSRGPPSFSA
jgi:hypothetical protein